MLWESFQVEDITKSEFFIRLHAQLFGFSFFCQPDKFILMRSKQKIFCLRRRPRKEKISILFNLFHSVWALRKIFEHKWSANNEWFFSVFTYWSIVPHITSQRLPATLTSCYLALNKATKFVLWREMYRYPVFVVHLFFRSSSFYYPKRGLTQFSGLATHTTGWVHLISCI